VKSALGVKSLLLGAVVVIASAAAANLLHRWQIGNDAKLRAIEKQIAQEQAALIGLSKAFQGNWRCSQDSARAVTAIREEKLKVWQLCNRGAPLREILKCAISYLKMEADFPDWEDTMNRICESVNETKVRLADLEGERDALMEPAPRNR
jgi:hypothetical protein